MYTHSKLYLATFITLVLLGVLIVLGGLFISDLLWIMGVSLILFGFLYLRFYFHNEKTTKLTRISGFFSLVGSTSTFLFLVFSYINCMYINRDVGCFVPGFVLGILGLGLVTLGLLLILINEATKRIGN